VAEGPLGVRALADGDRVAADERVVFFAATRARGELSLVEEAGGATTRVWPAAGGRWAVDVGRHAPGGDAPASWRPDRPVDAATYRARLCAGPEEAPPCVDAALRLRW
jgi:hypothetical protein